MSGFNNDLRIYARLLRQSRPYWPHLAAIFLLGLLSAPLALLSPWPLKMAIDSALGSHPLPGVFGRLFPHPQSPHAVLVLCALLLVAISLLISLHGLASWLLETYTGEKLVLNFRALLFRHVQHLSLAYHDTTGAADSTYRIQYDTVAIQNLTISGLMPIVSAVLTVFGMIYVISRIDWQLCLVALAVCPALLLVTRLFGARVRSRWRDLKKYDSRAMSVVQEALSSVRVVKAFGREDYEEERFLRQSRRRVRRQLRVAAVQGIFDVLVGLILATGTALTLYIGVSHVRAGQMSLGSFLVVMAYLAQVYQPLRTFSRKVTDVQSALASAERAFALLDELPEVADRAGARPLARAAGYISFRRVSFSYVPGQPVLRGVTFDVPAGARVGIVGRTGAGKTTILSLLTRLYDPTVGRILLDGLDLREYRLADLREQFSLVLQDPVLFSASIAENIAYARPAASQREIVRTAVLANAHDFIVRLPDRYQAKVGERGMRLSGGERQRISLARAFLKNAPILILDEPTSALDPATEAAVVEAIERLMRGRTTFIISHRPSTLLACDMLLAIEGGELRQVTPDYEPLSSVR